MKKITILFFLISVFIGAFAQKQALIVIDIQNDYFKGGTMELINPEKAAYNAQIVINKFRQNNLPVIYIQHINTYEGAFFFLPNTYGNKIHEIVKPTDGEKIIIKHYPNSFKETDLLEYLQNNEIKDVVIVGMMTHMCIDATTRAAKDLGYNCTLIGDACATCDLSYEKQTIPAKYVHAAYLSALNGAYANVMNTQNFLTKFKSK